VAGALALLLVEPIAVKAYEGTGVGNGGGGFTEANYSHLTGQIGSPTSRDDLAAWCDRASGVLRQELYRARRQIASGRTESARQTLIAAFRAVAITGDEIDSIRPMLARIARNAVMISDALDQKLPSSTGSDLLSKVRFLEKYAEFAVGQQADFDRDLYIPYLAEHRNCVRSDRPCGRGFDFDAFERRFFEVAVNQLRFVSDTFTIRSAESGMVYPKGHPAIFLVAAELMSGFVAEDIRDTFEAYLNACAVLDLEALQRVLQQYNWFGDRTHFFDDVDALAQVQRELDRVLRSLSPGNSCRHRYP
jgi:hypothetical protein